FNLTCTLAVWLDAAHRKEPVNLREQLWAEVRTGIVGEAFVAGLRSCFNCCCIGKIALLVVLKCPRAITLNANIEEAFCWMGDNADNGFFGHGVDNTNNRAPLV